MNIIELQSGALRLALRADLGACLAGLWIGDMPVLRSVEAQSLRSPQQGAGFALAPYAGQIAWQRFRWQGRDHQTQANVEGSPHSLHGLTWQRPWEVLARDAGALALRYRHRADGDWPFDFEIVQRIELQPGELKLHLRLVNTADVAQPVGLGWQHCFPKRARSRLHAEVSERWERDATGLSTRKVAQAGIDADLANLSVDHCFEGWHGPVRIRDELLSLRLSASTPYLTLRTRPDEDHFQVGPASEVGNALQMAEPLAHGLQRLEPGAGFEAWSRLEIGAVAAAAR